MIHTEAGQGEVEIMPQTGVSRSRRDALTVGAVIGAGLLLGGQAEAAGQPPLSAADEIQDILNTALTVERLAITFYYTVLTTPAVMHDPRLGGPSADPNNPGLPPGGDPSNVKYVQAALDAEVKHATALEQASAVAPYTRFYFPAGTFDGLGASTQPNSVLGRLDILETALVGGYAAGAAICLRLGRPDIATTIAQIMGVEAEHRVLGRVIGGVDAVANLATEIPPISSVAEAVQALRPFLTGQAGVGFSGRPTPPVPLPTPAQTRRVVGRYPTHLVRRFLQGSGNG